jgi:hypothetical protein
VGHPHKHVSALDRMTVLEEDGAHAHDHHHHHDRNGHNHG